MWARSPVASEKAWMRSCELRPSCLPGGRFSRHFRARRITVSGAEDDSFTYGGLRFPVRRTTVSHTEDYGFIDDSFAHRGLRFQVRRTTASRTEDYGFRLRGLRFQVR